VGKRSFAKTSLHDSIEHTRISADVRGKGPNGRASERLDHHHLKAKMSAPSSMTPPSTLRRHLAESGHDGAGHSASFGRSPSYIYRFFYNQFDGRVERRATALTFKRDDYAAE
jgi:hypothetical protein